MLGLWQHQQLNVVCAGTSSRKVSSRQHLNRVLRELVSGCALATVQGSTRHKTDTVLKTDLQASYSLQADIIKLN